jgi:uncharacterized iron-regulated membrane protein
MNPDPQIQMSAWQQWVQRPQTLWVRRALFQVHLWIGIGIGLYVVLISVSGSAIVYRPQLIRAFARQQELVAVSGTALSQPEITQRAQQAYPGYEVYNISISRRPDRPVTVSLQRGNERISRLFNPYTGADLGDPLSPMESVVDWLVDFHANLLSGTTGRFCNGVASIIVTLTSSIGLVLWWPGIKNWRRSTVINWKAKFPLFNWTLHSAIGFWCCLLVLMWGVSGIYFSFPAVFGALGDSQFLTWLVRLHFGRFGRLRRVTWFYWSLSMLWVVLGLIPVVLVVTGFLMWWNRVLRKKVLQPEGQISSGVVPPEMLQDNLASPQGK